MPMPKIWVSSSGSAGSVTLNLSYNTLESWKVHVGVYEFLYIE